MLQKDELIDLIELDVDGSFRVKEGKFAIDFECQKKRTLAIISLYVKDEIMPHIARILDRATMWQTLKNLFEQRNGAKPLHLMTKLTNL